MAAPSRSRERSRPSGAGSERGSRAMIRSSGFADTATLRAAADGRSYVAFISHMPIRIVRFESRNPIVVALFIAMVLALVGIVLTVGLAVGVALATVGVVALVARRLLGPRLP